MGTFASIAAESCHHLIRLGAGKRRLRRALFSGREGNTENTIIIVKNIVSFFGEYPPLEYADPLPNSKKRPKNTKPKPAEML
jgi:hypothetical protein